MNSRAYSSSDQDDLWSYLTDEARYHNVFDNEISVKEIMDTWTLQTGFPVVTVTRNYEDKSIDFKQVSNKFLQTLTNINKKFDSRIVLSFWSKIKQSKHNLNQIHYGGSL